MTHRLLAAAAVTALLSACGDGTSASDNAADQLERAADQSTPQAANVLENAADQIRDQNGGDANAAAQQALQAAGNAQAQTADSTAAPQAAPPAMGAKPHAPGDPVPPPKLRPGQSQGGGAGSNNPPAGADNH